MSWLLLFQDNSPHLRYHDADPLTRCRVQGGPGNAAPAACPPDLQVPSRAASTVATHRSRRVSIAAQSSAAAPAEQQLMECDDPIARQDLLSTPLWEVLLMLASSSSAAQTLHSLHSCAAGESSVMQQLAALQTIVCGLRLCLSSQRKYDCLLIVNLHELKQQVQATQRELDSIGKSRYDFNAVLRTCTCLADSELDGCSLDLLSAC